VIDGAPTSIVELERTLHPLLAILPRFGAAFIVLPLLKKSFVSRQVRMGFVIVLALVAYPHASATFSVTDWGPGQWLLFTMKEISWVMPWASSCGRSRPSAT
jgi:type III secretory pathway component EscT